MLHSNAIQSSSDSRSIPFGFVTRLSQAAAFQHESWVHKLFDKRRYKVFAQPKDFQLQEIYIH